MSDIPFLDTNVLLYSFGVDSRATQAQELMSGPFITGVQALNEFTAVARRKMRKEWSEIRSALDDIRLLATRIVPIDFKTHSSALELAERYNLAFYDACMVAAALQANSSLFCSEDLHHGLVVDGRLAISNPFR